MTSGALRVVCYVNQFFGQLGGEEKAGVGPQVFEGAIGAARAVQQALGDAGTIVATVICGDNYAAEHAERATTELVQLVAGARPDLLVAGPAFLAGRYGVACGALCAAVQAELKIPAVTGMHAENPGVELYRRQVYVVQTGAEATRMLPEVQRLVALGLKLARRETIGSPAAGRAFKSEVPRPAFPPVAPPRLVKTLEGATIALVTDGGLVPRGNPDGIEALNATRYGAYSIEGKSSLDAAQYDNPHRGYDTTWVKQDPHRLVPVDVARELEQSGAIGKLHETVYSTVGVATTLAQSARMGREIAEKLRAAGVDAVILTST
jgi:betaine reductase